MTFPKWATQGIPWMTNGDLPLYEITGETPERLYAVLVSGSGYVKGGWKSRGFINRDGAVFLKGPEAVDDYRAAWRRKQDRFDEIKRESWALRNLAKDEFDEAVKDLIEK